MATQAERRATTRAAIIDAARSLFATGDYAATGVSDILTAAHVSRGAMYHHFAGKEDVFAAVFVTTSSDAIRRAAERVPDDAGPLEALLAGGLGWLDVVSDPAIARILLVDGPAVLGWERARSLEEATSLGAMRRAVAAAASAGEIVVPSVDLAARLINAALAEAALIEQTRSEGQGVPARQIVESMITGLTSERSGTATPRT